MALMILLNGILNEIVKLKSLKFVTINTILLLDKQRFFCKHCNKTFTASTNIVDFHKQMFCKMIMGEIMYSYIKGKIIDIQSNYIVIDNNGIGYCLFTPLSDSETLYVKIYNISDNQTLIDDLSNPIDEISSILSKFQN